MLNGTQMTQIERMTTDLNILICGYPPDLRHLRAILYLFQNPYQ